jgi:hypothetical protein
VAVVAWAALAVGGCATAGPDGNSVDDGGTAPGADVTSANADTPLSREAAQLKFVECMRENGVEMDDPEPGGGIRLRVEPDTAAIAEQAQAICQPILDQAAAGDGGTGPEGNYDQMLAAAQCMRDKGYDYPDPEQDSAGRITQRFRADAGADVDREQLESDQQACQEQVGIDTPDEG